jgi:hypothetical protein
MVDARREYVVRVVIFLILLHTGLLSGLLFLPPIQGDAAYDATDGVSVGVPVCTLCRCLPFPELERGGPDIGTGAHNPENDDERMV